MTSTKGIVWLAGLLEGEGCFLFKQGLRIAVCMTDKDVVQRAADLLGAKSIRARKPERSVHKVSYVANVHGRRAAEWMMTLYPLLGERRQAKVREALASWKTRPGRGGNMKLAPAERRRQKAEQLRLGNERMTPEQRAALALKGWATRRARNNDQPIAAPQAARSL